MAAIREDNICLLFNASTSIIVGINYSVHTSRRIVIYKSSGGVFTTTVFSCCVVGLLAVKVILTLKLAGMQNQYIKLSIANCIIILFQ